MMTNRREQHPERWLGEPFLMDLRVEIIRTLVEEFMGTFPFSDRVGCGRASDFSGTLDGSTSKTAAFRR